MSLQRIINAAETIKINRRKAVGIQYTRSDIARVSETPTRNPWRFTVSVSAVFPYATARSLVEELDRLDKKTPEVITLSNNSKLSWMFAYQGELTQTQLDAMTVYNFSGNQLILQNFTTIAEGKIMFKAGDFIQIGSYPYPFTVVSTHARGTGGTETLTVHRPNFISDTYVGQGIVVGNKVNFNVLCVNMPTYSLVPGGKNALVKFDDNFELYEYTGTIL